MPRGDLTANKLLPRYDGPYEVVKTNANGLTYTINRGGKQFVAHHRQLRPWRDVPPYLSEYLPPTSGVSETESIPDPGSDYYFSEMSDCETIISCGEDVVPTPPQSNRGGFVPLEQARLSLWPSAGAPDFSGFNSPEVTSPEKRVVFSPALCLDDSNDLLDSFHGFSTVHHPTLVPDRLNCHIESSSLMAQSMPITTVDAGNVNLSTSVVSAEQVQYSHLVVGPHIPTCDESVNDTVGALTSSIIPSCASEVPNCTTTVLPLKGTTSSLNTITDASGPPLIHSSPSQVDSSHEIDRDTISAHERYIENMYQAIQSPFYGFVADNEKRSVDPRRRLASLQQILLHNVTEESRYNSTFMSDGISFDSLEEHTSSHQPLVVGRASTVLSSSSGVTDHNPAGISGTFPISHRTRSRQPISGRPSMLPY